MTGIAPWEVPADGVWRALRRRVRAEPPVSTAAAPRRGSSRTPPARTCTSATSGSANASAQRRVERLRRRRRDLQEAAARDVPLRVVAPHRPQRARRGRTGSPSSSPGPLALVGVDEDGPLLVVRAGTGPRLRGPAAQRCVRDEGDPLADPARAQTAAQRGTSLGVGVRDAGAARVVGVAEPLEGGGLDGPRGPSVRSVSRSWVQRGAPAALVPAENGHGVRLRRTAPNPHTAAPGF